MLTITPQAVQYIKERNSTIYLELPPVIDCCMHLQEAPIITLGHPPKPECYEKLEISEITVYCHHNLPAIPLIIIVASFLGFKRLAIEGWKLA